jgi:hypothetical protein
LLLGGRLFIFTAITYKFKRNTVYNGEERMVAWARYADVPL